MLASAIFIFLRFVACRKFLLYFFSLFHINQQLTNIKILPRVYQTFKLVFVPLNFEPHQKRPQDEGERTLADLKRGPLDSMESGGEVRSAYAVPEKQGPPPSYSVSYFACFRFTFYEI